MIDLQGLTALCGYPASERGLGRELLDELDRAVRRSLAFPQSYSGPTTAPMLCLPLWLTLPAGTIMIGSAHETHPVFEPAKEGGYTCFIEEIPAAISQGETLAEAKANLLDALKLVLQSQRELVEKDSLA